MRKGNSFNRKRSTLSGSHGVEGWITILPCTERQAFSFTPWGERKSTRVGPAILTLPLCSFYTTALLLSSSLHLLFFHWRLRWPSYPASLIVLIQPLTLCLFPPLSALLLLLPNPLSHPKWHVTAIIALWKKCHHVCHHFHP